MKFKLAITTEDLQKLINKKDMSQHKKSTSNGANSQQHKACFTMGEFW